MMTQIIRYLVLPLWVCTLLVVVGTLTASHWSSLPAPPPTDPALQQAIADSRRPTEAGRWLALHVLYAQCRCSQRIAENLLQTTRPTGIAERVLLMGEDAPLTAALQAAGFAVEGLTAAQLQERYGLQAAPLLVVANPADEVRYAGGYTDRKQGPVIRDRTLIAAAMGGEVLRNLPLFGCAVSESLQAALDPLGIKDIGPP